MVIDVFAQHLHLRIEHFVDLGCILQLSDEVLGACMLDLCCIPQIGILDRISYCGVEDFFLDLRVNFQLGADLLGV